MSSSYPTCKSDGSKSILFRHETVLLLVLAFEWFYFNSVGRRFGTLDNTFDIVRHSVEIGLLALVMTPIILAGGIDLSVGSLLGLCAILFGKLWRDAGFSPLAAGGCTLLIGALAGGLNASLITEWAKGRKLYGHLYDDLLKLKYLHQRYTNYLRWLKTS